MYTPMKIEANIKPTNHDDHVKMGLPRVPFCFFNDKNVGPYSDAFCILISISTCSRGFALATLQDGFAIGASAMASIRLGTGPVFTVPDSALRLRVEEFGVLGFRAYGVCSI